jgi:hypothetical protein
MRAAVLSSGANTSGKVKAKYWSSRRLIVDLTGPEGSSTIHLDKPFARVGRCPSADVVLAPKHAGACVAYIHATDDAIYVCSLGRSEEILLNPKRIRPGAGIRIGPYRLSVRLAETPSAPPKNGNRRDTTSVEARSACRLTFSSDERGAAVHSLQGLFAVAGREPPANVLLAHDDVARVQWVLHRSKGRLWIVNLSTLSEGGLDGLGSDVISLASGERVRLGKHWLSYSDGSAADVAPMSSKSSERPPLERLTTESQVKIVRPRLTNGACRGADVLSVSNLRSQFTDPFPRKGGCGREQLDTSPTATSSTIAEQRVVSILSDTNGPRTSVFPISLGNGVKPYGWLPAIEPQDDDTVLNRYDSVLDRLIDECQRERSGRWYRRMVAATCVVAGSAVIALCAYLFNFVAALD